MRILVSILATAAFACSSDSESTPQPSWVEAFDATSGGWLLSVWGPSSDDLYAVGGTPTDGRIVRFDGQRWTEQTIGLDVPLLNWVYGFGSDDLWAVGNEGAIIHFDGVQWTKSATVTDQDLWGVWGASPDDLWAVGGNGRSAGEATILRYDGQRWRSVEVPVLQRAGVNAFFKVWGTDARNLYIVGQNGSILRWDGQAFEEALVGTTDDLIAIWGAGPERIMVVGGRANGQIVFWDGLGWTSRSLAPRPGLNGVWMPDPETAYVVGQNGTVVKVLVDVDEDDQDPLTRAGLSFDDEVLADVVTLDFHAVFGTGTAGFGDRLVTVGGNFAVAVASFEGVAYELDLRAVTNNGQ